MLILAASLFFTNPVPLELPRAWGDKFSDNELALDQAVDGRWVDDELRIFMLINLAKESPTDNAGYSTRMDFEQSRRAIDKRDKKTLREEIQRYVDFELPEKERRPRQLARGYDDIDYWQGTNRNVIACAYLKEKSSVWRLALWYLAEGDDYDEACEVFTKEFLEAHADKSIASVEKLEKPSERELLRRDAHHSITNYPAWAWTDSEEFTVLDELGDVDYFRTALTNELKVYRQKYAETVPTGISVTNELALARIFSSRERYLEALATDGLTNITWTAAYWSPVRRELVAYLPEDGEKRLLSTIRHEAFHQYLSYATLFWPVSPWLNEGYAQYFEYSEPDYFCDPADMPELAPLVAPVLMMDYDEFYAGTDLERRLKYRVAHSIVYFLEQGADKVRFKPFKNLKADYFKALLETHDMRLATSAAFKNSDTLKLFVKEWTKFWEDVM